MKFPPVVELRQYTLRPGKRDELISLFEAQFTESQDACGAKILGTFRDLDHPTKFVWLRGFASIDERPRAGGVLRRAGVEASSRTGQRDDDRLR